MDRYQQIGAIGCLASLALIPLAGWGNVGMLAAVAAFPVLVASCFIFILSPKS